MQVESMQTQLNMHLSMPIYLHFTTCATHSQKDQSTVKGKSMQSSMWHCKRSEIGAFVYLPRYLHHAIKNIMHVVS